MNIDFDQILDKAREAVGAVAKKTDEVVEYSKLKYERAKLNAELERLHRELGVATYEAMKGEDCAEMMDALCEEIDLLLIDMAALDDMIDEKQKVVTCPKCGAKLDRECAYCSKCGNAMEMKTSEPEKEEKTNQPEPEDKCDDCECNCSDCSED